MQFACLLRRPAAGSSAGAADEWARCLFSGRLGLIPFAGKWSSAGRHWAPNARAQEQDHYAVLGISRCATSAEIKRAYRLLALKYHPDVSKDLHAEMIFKSIRAAYEVLSDEAARFQYNESIQYPRAVKRPSRTHDLDTDDWRSSRWSELRKQMDYEGKRACSWHHHRREAYRESSTHERGAFSDVLIFTFFTLFSVQIFGCRAALTICLLMSLLDTRLDTGYKAGHTVAWAVGGCGGILLALCIRFTAWLCGKNSSSFVAVVVVATWVAARLAALAPLPQGAVLALLYMSIKLQADTK